MLLYIFLYCIMITDFPIYFQSKTYDSVTDKFMDLSFEKTNSAYMLFYEWTSRESNEKGGGEGGSKEETLTSPVPAPASPLTLSPELEDWIWQDNMHFLRDKNIFEHTYFQLVFLPAKQHDSDILNIILSIN